jgi:hypothetical protein
MLCPCIKMRNSDWRASAFFEAPFRKVMNILLDLAQMCRLGDCAHVRPPVHSARWLEGGGLP